MGDLSMGDSQMEDSCMEDLEAAAKVRMGR